MAGQTAASAETAEQQLVRAHGWLRSQREIQFDFPLFVEPKPPPWADALVRAIQAIAPVLQVLFWCAVAAGVLLIVWFVAGELQGLRRGKRTSVGKTDWRPDVAAARVLLEDADRLAGEARYDEAMHLLLFRSIDELASHRPGAVRPAFTSRDIAGLDGLPAEPRDAFARIARAVETTFFGGRAADAEDFQRCRQDYETFAFSGAWR